MAKKRMIIAAASVMAGAAAASVPPAHRNDVLEVSFVELNGRRQQPISNMPVRIVSEDGRVVFDGKADGPHFVARLPKGRYIVSTRWDAWSSSRPVTIGKDRQRVVFAWGAPSATPAALQPAPQSRGTPPRA